MINQNLIKSYKDLIKADGRIERIYKESQEGEQKMWIRNYLAVTGVIEEIK
jgi:hypothetical protein